MNAPHRSRIVLMMALFACVVAGGTARAAAEKPADPARVEREQMRAELERTRAERRQKLEEAKRRLDAAANEVAELSMSLTERMPFAGGSRVLLGLNIGGARTPERAEGVAVLSVSPGGAAAEAGIKAGDVLVEIDGESLLKTDGQTPRSALREAMRELEPGEKVTLKYLRDGKSAVATLTPQAAEDRMWAVPAMPAMPAMPALPDLERFRDFRAHGDGPLVFSRANGVFGDVELLPMTPKLGQYFGTDKGLLVVRAPEDEGEPGGKGSTQLKLEEGDVILDIDGRVPTSPSHALRILASYQPGERLTVNVLRMKQRMALSIVLPERRSAWLLHAPPTD